MTLCTTDVRDASTRIRNDNAPSHSSVTRHVFPNLSNRLAYRHQAFLPVGLWHHLRRHALDFDVAHIHACRNLPAAIAWRCLKSAAVPYVVQPNGTAPAIERFRLAKRVFDAAIGRRVLEDAAALIAVSPAERRTLVGERLKDERIREIANPIDVHEFSEMPPPATWRRRWKTGEAPVVLFLGKITPRKKVDILIRAFALMKANARLVVAGNTMADETAMRQLVIETGVADRTIFTGLLTGPDRLAALADADVVVYPSEHEVFGLVALESLLAGTPVIVADDSGCGDLVNQTGAGLVVPVNDTHALAAAIQAILNESAEWRRRAARAAPGIRDRYSADVVCASLEALYESVVEKMAEGRSA